MSGSQTSRWTLPIVATAMLFAAFGLYMALAVPVLEGKSAAQIPKVDPLGMLKSETAGQWISLFAADSWQRDENHRNIIKADGNILVFQDYQEQEDGSLRVSRLCLLLFDKESQNENGDVDLDGQHYPTVVEAIDGAILSFDKSRPLAMGKYGELQQIQFLGQAQFWKESTDPQKVMFLQTHDLLVSGIKATTRFPVQFRFGDSVGRAIGLDLVFKNADLEQSMKPAVTKIAGIQLARFGNIQHLGLRIAKNERDPASTTNSIKEPGVREVDLKCSGPAEFFFDELYANFHNVVSVEDRESGYRLTGELMQVLFAASSNSAQVGVAQSASSQNNITDPAKSGGKKPKSQFLPRGLSAQRVIAQGNSATGDTARVTHQTEATELSAAQLEYDLIGQQFVASASIPGNYTDLFPKQVQLTADGLQLSVPQLRYRPANASAKPLGVENKSIGQVWAQGAGQLLQSQANQQMLLTWQEQLTLTDDQDLKDRKVFSVYGDAEVKTKIRDSNAWKNGLSMNSDQIHFWLKSQTAVDSQTQQFVPDLLLAQQNVKFRDSNLAGEFDEARVYFPEDAQPFTGKVAAGLKPHWDNLASTVQWNKDRVLLGRPDFQLGNRDQPITGRGAFMKADSLIVTLRTKISESDETQYEPAQIQLADNIILVEADLSGAKPAALESPSYKITGDRVTGIAQPSHLSPLDQGKTQFAWKIEGAEGKEAVVLTPQITLQSTTLHFDQAGNRVWSQQPGNLSFPLESNNSLFGSSLNVDTKRIAANQDPADEKVSGSGNLRWSTSMSFDGLDFIADGQVQCDIEQQNADRSVQKIQANSNHLKMTLNQAVQFSESKTNRAPQLSQLHLTSAEPNPQDMGQLFQPVRIYQQEFDSDGELISQEVAWAPTVVVDKTKQLISMIGHGRLWSVRRAESQNELTIAQVAHNDDSLNHIQVEFERELQGDLQKGQFVFNGPVHTIYGEGATWQVKEPLLELQQPVKLDCDQLILNRWQANKTSDYEMELEAVGSVHVIGQQFESIAQRLKFNRNQDLLTIEGDTRNAAKFWQDNPQTGKRNQMVAQKIWYRPTSRWFNFEGFKEGDITFFARQK